MGGSILVVEDEAAIRDLLAANLQRAGYKVMCAGDVPQAEALVRDSRPDLVLLDWVLPGVPGLTFARRLRNDQRTKDISIVLLSARAEEQDKVTALESGADDYVTKPFSARELLARIKAVMRRRAPQLADDVVGKLRCAAAHDGLDPRQQLARGERLGDVVVGAAFQRRDLVLLLGARREQHDGDVLGALVVA